MDYNKLKKEVESTVKKQADDYFEDMQCHPQDYSEWVRTSDEDDCWECAIEKAKDDMKEYPKACLDEDFQEEMEEQDWYHVWEITDEITWRTFANQEIEKAFK